MKLKSRITLASLVFSLVLVAVGVKARQSAEDPAVLLERAIQLETVDGDLEAAIEQYQQIIADNGNHRATAAKALLRLGGCYEKLGQKEARTVYERLVNEYPDQSREAEAARERLAELAQVTTARKPNFRKIHIPTKLPIRGSGMLSPDGQKLAFVSGGSLWVVPVHGKSDPDIAGAPVRLTQSMHAWDASNNSLAWSADGKWIGFRVAVPRTDRHTMEQEVYVVPAEGGKTKRLPVTWRKWAGDVYTLRYALSRNAETLYFADGTKSEELRIYSMPVMGGERVPVTEPITREPSLSPDGSRIAYVSMHLRPDGNMEGGQIWMSPLGGGNPVLICEDEKAGLWSPIWSRDGSMIAFLSSSGKGGNRHQQIWVVRLSDRGDPSPPAKFDLPGQTNQGLSGWTHDNKIGILVPTDQHVLLYSVPASGGKATQLTTAYTCMPVWAPDGTRIYFDGAHTGYRAHLESVPAEGGTVTRISVLPENLQPAFPSELTISSDGRTLLFAGFYRYGVADPNNRLFTVPSKGGTVTPLEAGSARWALSPKWSPDETQIAFISSEEVEPELSAYNIFVMLSAGGEPQRLSSPDDRVSRATIAWSPDGEVIAFYGRDNTLRLIPANGGSSRVLVGNVGGGIPWAGIAWSPDGKQVAYTAGGDLWVVSCEGGRPTQIETGLDARHLKIDWSPDGKQIALTASKGGEPELWLMEDFLPLVKTER